MVPTAQGNVTGAWRQRTGLVYTQPPRPHPKHPAAQGGASGEITAAQGDCLRCSTVQGTPPAVEEGDSLPLQRSRWETLSPSQGNTSGGWRQRTGLV